MGVIVSQYTQLEIKKKILNLLSILDENLTN